MLILKIVGGIVLLLIVVAIALAVMFFSDPDTYR